MRLRLFTHFLVNLNHILVHQLLVQTTLLRTELAGPTPHHGIAKLGEQVSMDLHDAGLDSEAISAGSQIQGVGEVGSTTLSLGVDAEQGKLIPDFVE